jgi:hypothetical protein
VSGESRTVAPTAAGFAAARMLLLAARTRRPLSGPTLGSRRLSRLASLRARARHNNGASTSLTQPLALTRPKRLKCDLDLGEVRW